MRAISASPLGYRDESLALPLLVARIGADHKHPPVAADDLALLAHRLDRGSYFHAGLSSRLSWIETVASARLWRPQGVAATALKIGTQPELLRCERTEGC